MAALTLPQRRNALPEEKVYPDTGCHVSPHCLPSRDRQGNDIPGTGCPLPRCVLDRRQLPPHVAERRKRVRMAKRLRLQGMQIRAIAKSLGTSTRSVMRYLAASRAAA